MREATETCTKMRSIEAFSVPGGPRFRPLKPKESLCERTVQCRLLLGLLKLVLRKSYQILYPNELNWVT